MGAVLTAISKIGDPCQSFAKYVLNDAKCHSRCCKDVCDCEAETHPTEIGSDSESIDAICCGNTLHARD